MGLNQQNKICRVLYKKLKLLQLQIKNNQFNYLKIWNKSMWVNLNKINNNK